MRFISPELVILWTFFVLIACYYFIVTPFH